jgi:hypothetical protein
MFRSRFSILLSDQEIVSPGHLRLVSLSLNSNVVLSSSTPSCLRNIVSLFHHIEKERAWRKEQGRPEGFATLGATKPIGELATV